MEHVSKSSMAKLLLSLSNNKFSIRTEGVKISYKPVYVAIYMYGNLKLELYDEVQASHMHMR